jgi:hypothetical protein
MPPLPPSMQLGRAGGHLQRPQRAPPFVHVSERRRAERSDARRGRAPSVSTDDRLALASISHCGSADVADLHDRWSSQASARSPPAETLASMARQESAPTCSRERTCRRREGDEEGVALRVHLDTAVRLRTPPARARRCWPRASAYLSPSSSCGSFVEPSTSGTGTDGPRSGGRRARLQHRAPAACTGAHRLEHDPTSAAGRWRVAAVPCG